MENIDRSAMLAEAVRVAKLAGKRLQGIGQRRVNSDKGNDVKLQEDVESELFIRNELSGTNIPVLGEERGGDTNLVFNDGLYWIVDPIDGTYNFLRAIPGVCVSIALMKGLKPVVGAIFDFTHNELFAGAKGLPLTLNGAEITPHWASNPNQAVLMTGFPSATDYSDENLKRFVLGAQSFKKVRMCGSACAAISWVAAGRADLYYESRLYLWDVAAGLSLIESAGGVYDLKVLGVPDKPLCVAIQAGASKELFLK